MTEAEAARLNAKYPAFYLSRFSKVHGRYVASGKPYADIRDALAAAARCDKRNPEYMTFIDTKLG